MAVSVAHHVLLANCPCERLCRRQVTYTQLLYNILSCAGAFTGAAFTDRINRRSRLYVGCLLLAVLLAIVAALSSKFGQAGNTNVNGAHATIAMIFLFGVSFSFIYTPLQSLYCAEVMNQQMRAKGMAVHVILANAAGFINTFANAVGLERWGYKCESLLTVVVEAYHLCPALIVRARRCCRDSGGGPPRVRLFATLIVYFILLTFHLFFSI